MGGNISSFKNVHGVLKEDGKVIIKLVYKHFIWYIVDKVDYPPGKISVFFKEPLKTNLFSLI